MNFTCVEKITPEGEDDALFQEVITSMGNIALVGGDTIDNANTSALSSIAPRTSHQSTMQSESSGFPIYNLIQDLEQDFNQCFDSFNTPLDPSYSSRHNSTAYCTDYDASLFLMMVCMIFKLLLLIYLITSGILNMDILQH